MKTKVREVITYKKQTSKTKYVIEAALEYRPPLKISRHFFSKKKIKAAASIQENTVHRGKTGFTLLLTKLNPPLNAQTTRVARTSANIYDGEPFNDQLVKFNTCY